MATKNLGDLDIVGNLLMNGASGSPGQVLESNGLATPSWVDPPSDAIPQRSGYYYGQFGASAGATLTLNRLYFVPFYVPATVTYTRIAIYTSTSVATAISRLGIYTSTTSGFPDSLVMEAGTVSGSGTGTKSITISQNLSAGFYWLACVGQNAAPAQRCVNTSSPFVAQGTVASGVDANPGNGYYVDSITGSLPSTVTPTLRANTSPIVYLGI